MAESLYVLPPERHSLEVKDCAALVRFSYREALAKHDGAWAARIGLDGPPPAFPSVRQSSQGPQFATGNGRELRYFADADTLRRANTFLVGRQVSAARPGDLLFYQQPDQEFRFHVMVYLGPSHFEKQGEWVVYHTGPVGAERGEIRRVRITDLLEHREPRWRPQVSNPRFLGVYRWNILRAGG